MAGEQFDESFARHPAPVNGDLLDAALRHADLFNLPFHPGAQLIDGLRREPDGRQFLLDLFAHACKDFASGPVCDLSAAQLREPLPHPCENS